MTIRLVLAVTLSRVAEVFIHVRIKIPAARKMV